MADNKEIVPAEDGRVAASSRAEKVKAIFGQFDKNDDGRLSKEEMAALVVAVNPSVRFSEEQIAAILDEVFRTYGAYIDSGGLSLDGLRRTYDDGAGDVDRDFDALGLTLAALEESQDPKDLGKGVDKTAILEAAPPLTTGAAATPAGPAELSPAVKQLLEELEQTLKDGESGAMDASNMQKVLAEMRHRADTLPSRSPAESFDAHMEMGWLLGAYSKWEEALRSYRRAVALRPEDARAHFRIGNTHFQLTNYVEARDSYERALQVARTPVDSKLLPQIHVNLGVALEYDGYLMGACEHYREAAILNPHHHRSLKHLGSALFALGELRAAVEALQHAVALRGDYADAQVDLGNALYGLGNLDDATNCFKKAVELDDKHIEALYNLANVKREQNQFQDAMRLYERVLDAAADGNAQATEWTWKMKLNHAVCMLAMGQGEETEKALTEVYKETGKRVEIYELRKIIKNQKANGNNAHLLDTLKSMGTSHTYGQPPQARAPGDLANKAQPTVRFARANHATSTPTQVKWALEIRAVQKMTRLGVCLPVALRREASDSNLPEDRRVGSPVGEGKIVRKANVEKIFRRLLDNHTNPQSFAQAMKHINQRMLAVLDKDENGTVDLGKVLAVVAILCGAPMEDRKRAAYDIMLWRARKEDGQLPRSHAIGFFRDLHMVYKPKHESMDSIPPVQASGDEGISHQEFSAMFEDNQIGFNYLQTLETLENYDRVRHHGMKCNVSGYNIVGPRFYCTNGNFNLCATTYAEMQVPLKGQKLEQYIFEEYALEKQSTKLGRMACYSPRNQAVLGS
mmetsp:Transcript_24516/g.46494  ORF Transcript_24516/g.46494 Transcript_24516/m.46494 type:complete len:802 (+) Transcript_24516:149-2554(+)